MEPEPRRPSWTTCRISCHEVSVWRQPSSFILELLLSKILLRSGRKTFRLHCKEKMFEYSIPIIYTRKTYCCNKVKTICKPSLQMQMIFKYFILRSNKLNDSQDCCDHWIPVSFSFSHRMHHSIDDPTLGRCWCSKLKYHNHWLLRLRIYSNKSNVRRLVMIVGPIKSKNQIVNRIKTSWTSLLLGKI